MPFIPQLFSYIMAFPWQVTSPIGTLLHDAGESVSRNATLTTLIANQKMKQGCSMEHMSSDNMSISVKAWRDRQTDSWIDLLTDRTGDREVVP